ncbi:MAG TPA: hypothetical protein VG077_19760 [Verrucomicrobiae bacterium]|nr:hypothetical protein [Verrucomicrobiae bacterium]
MNKPQFFTKPIVVSLICLALPIFIGSALADNAGSGGVITYTDSSGLNPVSSPPYVGGYVVHTFTNNGTLTIFSSVNADVLVVGGGGGGGGIYGGGGGAGGLVYSNLSLSAGSYPATVGAGGAGTGADTHGANGANSVFATLTALGGGGGGIGYLGPVAGQAGGSGGGSGGASPFLSGGAATQPASASGGFGNNGGSGTNTSNYGGGGGAGAMGTQTNGGDGLQYSISGVNTYYAGGGGGIVGGAGGLGGGGNPGSGDTIPGDKGVANTGGGGGGGFNATGGNGGSGLIIVRYPYVPSVPVAISLASPTSGQYSTVVTATVNVGGGTSPYSVTYHYKLTTDSSFTATSPVGPFGGTNNFSKNLGVLSAGDYQIYATVTDNVAGTATSATNTFTIYVAGNSGLGGTITYTDPSGLNPVSAPPYVGGYVVHTFTNGSGTLTVPSSGSADVLVVGGGGGGGALYGDGGGAGGLVYSNFSSLSAGTYTVTVGAGGSGRSQDWAGGNGGNSVFGSIVALGGGGGGVGNLFGIAGVDGGSGGGSGGGTNGFTPGTGLQPSSASGGYGNDGFDPVANGAPAVYGGGGGAGAQATDANGSAGGIGLQYGISGVSTYYAGGGGGASFAPATSLGGGGIGGDANQSSAAGADGTANTGGGGGGGWNANSGNGGSGVVIVRYPYNANPSLSVVLAGTNSQTFFVQSTVSATAFVAGGSGPYSVTYHYKPTTNASYTATAAVGPFDASSTFEQTLGTLPAGSYQIYATVTDNAAGTATSMTNIFAVSLTTTLVVQDANFENPGVLSANSGWAHIATVWNPGTGTYSEYGQNSLTLAPDDANVHFYNTCPGGIDWYALMSANIGSISQDLHTNVNAGDTISMTFYGGRGVASSSTAAGGVYAAAFLVGATPYSMTVDCTVLTNGTWQLFTLAQAITNSGDLSLQFTSVSGNGWLDNITVTRTVPASVVVVPPVLGAPRISGGNLILTGTGGTPDSSYTWLQTTNLAPPVIWTTNLTGTLDGAGSFSNSIPVQNRPGGVFFRLRLP